MRLAVTGGTGLVGRSIVAAALAAGHEVTLLGRQAPAAGAFGRAVGGAVAHRHWSLDAPAPDLAGMDGLVHAAFDHVPGRYRGGEGDDPEGFVRRNLTGSLRLFDATPGRIVFLSSRAVYGDWPAGTVLHEDRALRPDTLYGRVKAEAEAALAARGDGVSLRATGVYGPPGPGQRHKWADLFDAFLAGLVVAPRVATEVLDTDLAAAVLIALGHPQPPAVLNLSDLVLDRHDLLAEVARLTGTIHALPPRSGAAVSVMPTARLEALGWRPSGTCGLRRALPQMIATL